MDLANASSSLPNLTSSVSSEDEVSEREENATPLLPFQHGTTADESSSSESDSSEDRASVDARLLLDQGKPSPVLSVQKISEHKSEVARRPSLPASVAPSSGRSHDESKRTFSTQAMNHSRHGSSTSAHSVNKPKLTIDKDMSDGLISSYMSTEVDKFTLEERNERRAAKQRRNRTDSIESFELKEAAKLGLKEHPTEPDEEADPRVTWDANIEAAREALARARGDGETPEEFQRRCEALQRSEQRLREIRVDEDGELAQDLFEQELEDAANRAYAEALDREERENEMRLSANVKVAQRATEREEAKAADLEKRAAAKRREAEGHKQIIVDYLEREALRTREKSVDIEQKRVAHSRASSRVGSVRIDSPKIIEWDTTIPQVDIVLTPVLPKRKNKTKTPVAAPAGNTRVTHNWYDRIVLQHIQQSDIEATGVSGIPDMNVAWDNQGIAYETEPAPSRGSSAHPREQEEAQYCARLIREVHANKVSKVQSSKLSGPVEVDKAGQARAGNTHTANSELPGHGTAKDSMAKCANNHASVNPHVSSTIKKEKDTPFYMRAGTNPPSPAKVGDSRGKSPVSGDPEESDSPGSSTSSDESTSENNGTDESEETSSSEDDVDSSWEEDPTELCSEIVRCTQMGISSRKTRTGKAYGIQGGSYPPNDSPSDSSSSEEETKPKRSNSSSQPIVDSGPIKKGPSKTARKNPDESERSRKRRVHRNNRRNHHSHGSRSQKLGEYSFLEPGDPISAGVPLQQQRKWRHGIKCKLYQLVQKPGSAGEKPAWKSRPGGHDGGGKGIGKKPVPAYIKCFNCSGNHYKDDCPDNERMNAIEEEAEEPPKDEEKDSESDYTLKSFSDYGQSDTEERVGGMTERFGHMGEYDDADVGDSGDESEDEPELKGASPGTRSKENTFNAAATMTTKPVIKIHSEPSVFGVCDDYSSDEFIGEKDLEKLAKKMATHVIWQGNTAEVEEFLFATGEVSSLSVPENWT
ncbi:hypothetical protein C8R44DRAFT_749431 [Mycena epipterygia]|nr:hypothetical protein C8R44DRAFT_749431 [Mycena epipterygia]